MSVFAGDFLGFRLGNIHSSQLNITRVSSNDRYTETLTPTFKDRTAEIPGADGMYYWGTQFTQKTFVIDFAFDALRPDDLRQLRNTLNFRGVQELIFDEEPYKKYYVKCQAPPTLKYLAFDEGDIRIYKGEGSVTFIAYYPYALAVNESKVPSVSGNNIYALLSNIGDLDAPLKFYFGVSSTSKNFTITLKDNMVGNDEVYGLMTFKNLKAIGNDEYVCIDTQTNLIEGLIKDSSGNYIKTGNLYNYALTAGDFFKLPVGSFYVYSNISWEEIIYVNRYY